MRKVIPYGKQEITPEDIQAVIDAPDAYGIKSGIFVDMRTALADHQKANQPLSQA